LSRFIRLAERIFLQYGAGAHLFVPLTRWRHWNHLSWVIIIVGILGWIFALWYIQRYLIG
jgi:hypothetical protein